MEPLFLRILGVKKKKNPMAVSLQEHLDTLNGLPQGFFGRTFTGS